MSKRKRRYLTAELKARVALETLKEEKSIRQIAKNEDVASTQIRTWKKELGERMSELFERKNVASDAAKESDKQAGYIAHEVTR